MRRSAIEVLVDQATGHRQMDAVRFGVKMPTSGPCPTDGMTYAQILSAIAGLTELQRDALGFVAIGVGHDQPADLLRALCEAKLVIPFRDAEAGGAVRIGMELRVHMAWCEWCSENSDDEDGEEEA